MATTIYQDLKDALQTFKDFLDANVTTIKPAIQALISIIPQLGDLLNQLIDLMGKLKAEIQKLDPGAVPGLDKVSAFMTGAKTLLTTAENLLPAQKSAIDQVLGVISVAEGLPTLTQLKQEILNLIDAVVADLTQLKP